MSARSAQSGEFDFIRWLRRQARFSERVEAGIGDDAAVVEVPGRKLLLTCDAVVEGVHFDPSEASPYEIGWKAVGASLSDIAAMGGVADYALAAVSLSKRHGTGAAREMYRGMAALAEECSVELVGGNVTSAPRGMVVSVCSIGHVPEGGEAILRSGARLGDAVMVTGELGGSLLGRHLSFRPRLAEAARLVSICSPTAMIDVSDGLVIDLSHILEESGVGALLYEEAIPVSSDGEKLAIRTGKRPLEHAMYDGEDYELLFTVSPEEAALLKGEAIGVRVSQIGEVTDGGMKMRLVSGDVIQVEPGGYEHQLG